MLRNDARNGLERKNLTRKLVDCEMGKLRFQLKSVMASHTMTSSETHINLNQKKHNEAFNRISEIKKPPAQGASCSVMQRSNAALIARQ